MMRNINSRTCENVYTILNELNLFHKLPKEKQKFIEMNKDKKYKCRFNKNIPVQFQIHDKETMVLLSYLYLKYINTDEKIKNRLLDRYKKNEIEYQEELSRKYNIEDIFKDSKIKMNPQRLTLPDNNAMIPYKETLLRKILNKIGSLFHQKNK